MRAVVLCVALAAAPNAALADFTGRVVKVADGDTLTVLVQNAVTSRRKPGDKPILIPPRKPKPNPEAASRG